MGRHLDVDAFVEYVDSGVPVDHVIPGEPRLVLFFDPAHSELGLRLPGVMKAGDPGLRLETISIRRTIRAAERVLEVYLTDAEFFADGYSLLCSLADRVQLDHLSFDTALAQTVRTFEQLVKKVPELGVDREVGLFAEIFFLDRLAGILPNDEAVSSWVGPRAEEHDFVLETFDVEVKATLAERRSHWIASLTQLTAKPHRGLWLVSCQLTRAGLQSGASLADLIDRVRGRLAVPAIDRFNESLAAAGWTDRLRSPTASRYLLRSQPAAFEVDGTFPRLDAGILAPGATESGIEEVRYRIDLSDRSIDQMPGPFRDLLTAGVTDG